MSECTSRRLCWRNTGNSRLTADLLLPAHLIVEVVKLLEEVVDLAALVVPLGGVKHAALGLLGQILANVWDGKYNLLHGAVVAHNLANEVQVIKTVTLLDG